MAAPIVHRSPAVASSRRNNRNCCECICGARTIRIPVHMMESISKVVRKSRQMLNEIGREPTPEELAEKLGMPFEKVRKVLKIAKTRVERRRVRGFIAGSVHPAAFLWWRRRAQGRDCVAGVRRLELRNPCESYVFEMS